MRSLVLLLLVLCCGCSDRAQEQRPVLPALRTVKADFVLPAFGGKLLGTDHGEFVGELLFQDADGGLERVLHENVHGIVENKSGIFVFTGLRHLHTNVGYIYEISLTANNDVVANRLGRIPGAPSNVTWHSNGSTTFLVATNRQNPNGGLVHECYELVGKVVNPSFSCVPPPHLGANNSFKPTPLRGVGKAS